MFYYKCFSSSSSFFKLSYTHHLLQKLKTSLKTLDMLVNDQLDDSYATQH